MHNDTIAAQATPAGRGGVSILRVSGPLVVDIAQSLISKLPRARFAQFQPFLDSDGSVIDMGITLYFPKPHSFTGEDVIEFHGHGGPVVADLLLQRILQLGARLAQPGEFSQRAFLNGKIDLAQAEAIADLIDSGSQQAARSAIRSLQGVFSRTVVQMVEDLIQLRVEIEATIDFPEEEIDAIQDQKITNDIKLLLQKLGETQKSAQQGVILRDGLTIVLAGEANAGKSTLLNQLTGRDSAIVTEIAGTTRDPLHVDVIIDGLPIHIVDTAGLRESDDVIEQEGIKRAWDAITQADRVILAVDMSQNQAPNFENLRQKILAQCPQPIAITILMNKIDLIEHQPAHITDKSIDVIYLSAKTGQGIELLRQHLKQVAGFDASLTEGTFIARRRHLDALSRADQNLKNALQQQDKKNSEIKAAELIAEELRLAQRCLSEITGEFSADDLLGEIFSSFCIGK